MQLKLLLLSGFCNNWNKYIVHVKAAEIITVLAIFILTRGTCLTSSSDLPPELRFPTAGFLVISKILMARYHLNSDYINCGFSVVSKNVLRILRSR